MKRLKHVLWGAARAMVVLGAVLATGILMARDEQEQAVAAHTEIMQSSSSSSPTTLQSIVLVRNAELGGANPCAPGADQADPTDRCVWIWAKNVDNTTGASAYELNFTYNSSLVRVHSFIDFTTWLASTGRSITCINQEWNEDPATGYGEGRAACNSLLPPPPYGATGNGLLAYVALESRGAAVGATVLDFSDGTVLLDTPPNPDNTTAIPAVVRSLSIVVAYCADYTGDGGVPDGTIRVNDILYIVSQYRTPGGDLDGDGNTLVNDILISVQEYFANCWR